MGFDNAYEALTDVADDQRWAFGTGFADPFAGMDADVPPGIDGAALAEYCVMLADDALIMSHRLQEWLTRAPELEEETALANIALDLLGQARLLYSRAAVADGSGQDEDAYAFTRAPAAFRNVCFVERRAGDFAELVFQLLVFSSFRLAQLVGLRRSADPVLAAVAGKGVPEVQYHRDYAAQWVARLGDGTAQSRERMGRAINRLLAIESELFASTSTEDYLAAHGVAVRPATLRQQVDEVMIDVLNKATVPLLTIGYAQLPASGRVGSHTSQLEEILREMQSVAREHEGARW